MKTQFIALATFLIGCYMTNANALTINGAARSQTLKVCFDDASIMTVVPNLSELKLKKKWVKDAVLNESWGYYTNVNFTGWGSCSATLDYDIKIKYENGGVWSGGDTIALPFYNASNLEFERYHIVSGTIHEIGHQLNFPHEHNRLDSSSYSDEGGNQKFRFTKANGSAFTSGSGPFQIRVESGIKSGTSVVAACLTTSTANPSIVTQQKCSSTNTAQQFTLTKNGSALDIASWPKPATDWVSKKNSQVWANIKSVNNGQCLDVRGGTKNVGDRLITYSCNASSQNQQFSAMRYGYSRNLKDSNAGAVYGLQIALSNLWVDVLGGDQKAGNEVAQWDAFFKDYRFLTSAYDKHSVMSYENGSARASSYILLKGDIDGARSVYGNSAKKNISEYIVAKLSNKCLNYNSSATNKFTQQPCSTAAKTQQFRISWLSKNEFRIYDSNNNKCLADRSGVLSFEKCAPEDTNNDITEQRFTMPEGESATWKTIRSRAGRCLDLDHGNTTSGTRILLWGCHKAGENDNQLFKITR